MSPKRGPLTRKGRLTKSATKKSSNLPDTSVANAPPTDIITLNPPPASRTTPPSVSLLPAPVTPVANSQLP